MTEEEERVLITRCLNNERSAQELLYKTHCNKMYTVCTYYAENRDEAADFLQEGFITVFGKLHLFKFKGSLEGWIRRIIVNTALSAIRKKKRMLEVSDEFDQIADYSEEEIQIEAISKTKVIKLVNDLPTKAGLVMKLYAIEGYSHQEISEILDISVGTSKSQLNRARKLLRVQFEKS